MIENQRMDKIETGQLSLSNRLFSCETIYLIMYIFLSFSIFVHLLFFLLHFILMYFHIFLA